MHCPRTSAKWILLLVSTAGLSSSCRPAATATADTTAPTVAALQTEVADMATQIGSQGTIISYLATLMPHASAVPTGHPAATPPVTGSVVIEEGRCCVGAVAGETVPIRVAFQAFSPNGQVTDMRVRVGLQWFQEEEFTETDWEPFAATTVYNFFAPLNWSGFYVSAQFRDGAGWLSPVYYDDISVEGMPPPPTPAPTP